jgi:hypothetical protein
MKVTNPPYSTQEMLSNLEAYAMYPWGERLTKEGDEAYLRLFRSDKRGLVYAYQEAPNAQPYLYVHCMHYGTSIEELLEDDFTGEDSFYRVKDSAMLREKFQNAGDIIYISNITADKSVKLPDKLKPRLKVMPDIIASIFADTQAQTAVLYTHRKTAVHQAILALPEQTYVVEITPYEVVPKNGDFNANRDVDCLEVILIRKR